MSKYIGPKLRITRRLGQLRGLTRKKTNQRVYKISRGRKSKFIVIPPGQHGRTKLFKRSRYNTSKFDFLIRLKVKQRLRYNYGLTERQLVSYVRKAKKNIESTGQALLQYMEMRLDNIVFRLNMAPTIMAARQIINHGHIVVNNQRLNIPSYSCKLKDVISVAPKQKSLKLVTRNLSQYYKETKSLQKFFTKTLAFVLSSKMKAVPSIASAANLIREGKVSVQKRKSKVKKVWRSNYICPPGAILQVATKNEIVKIGMPKSKIKKKRRVQVKKSYSSR